MDEEYSRTIYQELISGAVINKLIMSGDKLVENRLYGELTTPQNWERYKHIYHCIGYDLNVIGDCIYLTERGKSDGLPDVSMHIHTILVILVRGISQLPLLTSVITTHQAGITRDQINSIGENDEYRQIMLTVGLHGSFEKEVENILVMRRLAYWNHKDRLVLSSGGSTFLGRMLSEVAPSSEM